MIAVRPLAVVALGGLLFSTAILSAPAQIEQLKPRVDRYGDPLPKGAIGRLGTVRLREGLPIESVTYAKDGRTLASGGTDGVIRFWNAETGKELRRLEGHEHHVNAVALSPDGRWLASGEIGILRLWDLASGKVARQLRVGGGVRHLVFSPDSKMLLSSTGDGAVRWWKVSNGKELHRLDERDAAVAFTPDSKQVVLGRWDVQFRDASTGKEVKKLERLYVSALAVTEDGSRLAVAGEKAIELFDMATGKKILQFTPKYDWGPSSMAFSADGKTLVSTNRDQTIRLWEVASGKERKRIQQRTWVREIAMAPDGKTFASAGPFNYIQMWDTATGEERFPVEGHQGIVKSLAFMDNRKKIVTGSDDGTVRLWDIDNCREVRRLLTPPPSEGYGSAGIDAVAVSPDGRWIAAGGYYYGKVFIFAADTGKSVHELNETTGAGLAFSPDSRRLACGGPAGEVELRDVATGRRLHSMKGHKYGIHALAFSPDGKTLVSSTLLDRAILFWDTAKGQQVRKINGDKLGALQSLVFTADGKWLLAEGTGNTISLWDVTSGKETPRFKGMHGYMVHALSPDGRTVAVASFGGNDRHIRLYDMASGKERHRFEGHLSRIYGLAFSPDNTILASAGEDTTVLLWDLTGKVALQRTEK